MLLRMCTSQFPSLLTVNPDRKRIVRADVSAMTGRGEYQNNRCSRFDGYLPAEAAAKAVPVN